MYRGSAIPGLNSAIFTATSPGLPMGLEHHLTRLQRPRADGLATPASMSSFGEDQAGKLYFLNYGGKSTR